MGAPSNKRSRVEVSGTADHECVGQSEGSAQDVNEAGVSGGVGSRDTSPESRRRRLRSLPKHAPKGKKKVLSAKEIMSHLKKKPGASSGSSQPVL